MRGKEVGTVKSWLKMKWLYWVELTFYEKVYLVSIDVIVKHWNCNCLKIFLFKKFFWENLIMLSVSQSVIDKNTESSLRYMDK